MHLCPAAGLSRTLGPELTRTSRAQISRVLCDAFSTGYRDIIQMSRALCLECAKSRALWPERAKSEPVCSKSHTPSDANLRGRLHPQTGSGQGEQRKSDSLASTYSADFGANGIRHFTIRPHITRLYLLQSNSTGLFCTRVAEVGTWTDLARNILKSTPFERNFNQKL